MIDRPSINLLVSKGVDVSKTLGLYYAAILGNKVLVNFFIEQGDNINRIITYPSYGSRTILIEIISRRMFSFAQWLIEECGADINPLLRMNFDYKHALINTIFIRTSDSMIMKEREKFINYLFNKEISLKHGVGGTILCAEILAGDLKTIELIVQSKDVDLNRDYPFTTKELVCNGVSKFKWSPFELAYTLAKGNAEYLPIVACLLGYGVVINFSEILDQLKNEQKSFKSELKTYEKMKNTVCDNNITKFQRQTLSMQLKNGALAIKFFKIMEKNSCEDDNDSLQGLTL